jgi:hypothetical protein
MPTNPHLNQERAEYLHNRAVIATERLPQWPRDNKMLPVVELEVDWVRFSTLNHRTTAERFKACRDQNNPNLFDNDPLGTIAQAAQCDLLRAHKGFEDLKNDLRERGQRETAVVTAEGILINGNRRVAAMRELYRDEHNLDAHYVRGFVLPADATADEVRELEAELQVSKTFLEDYSWINRGFLLKELLVRHGQNFDLVAEIMRMKVKEVKEDDRKFMLVDQLVAMSGQSYMHVDFEPNESAFEELSDHIANKSPAEANAVRYSYFLGILGKCRYRDLRHLRRANALEYVESEIDENPLLERTIASIESASAGGASSEVDELLGEALGPRSAASKVESLVAFLATKNRPDETINVDGAGPVSVEALLQQVNTAVTQAARDARDDDEEARTVQGPIRYVRDAQEKVSRATVGISQARALPDWSEPAFREAMERLIDAVTTLQNT